jgi:hypothetical protein
MARYPRENPYTDISARQTARVASPGRDVPRYVHTTTVTKEPRNPSTIGISISGGVKGAAGCNAEETPEAIELTTASAIVMFQLERSRRGGSE